MKLLILDVRASHRGTNKSALGGITRFNMIIPELVKKWTTVDIIIEKNRTSPPQVRNIFKYDIIWKEPWRFRIISETFRLMKYVTEINSKYKYDVILSPSIAGINNLVCFLLVILGLKNGSKILVTFYHKSPISKNFIPHSLHEFGEWFDFKLLNFILKFTDGIITISKASKMDLIKIGISESKIFLSGCFIDHKKLENYYVNHLDMLRRKKTIFDCCFAGRMARDKGVFDLLEIFDRVKVFIPNVKVSVMGAEYPLQHEWKTAVNFKGLSQNLEYFGQVEKSELYEIMTSSKVFVFPSHAEGWGISIAEAMALGLPVVAWDIPALRENFGEAMGVFLIPEYDYEEFVEVLLKILKSNLILELSENNRIYSSKFNQADVISKEIYAIERIMKY